MYFKLGFLFPNTHTQFPKQPLVGLLSYVNRKYAYFTSSCFPFQVSWITLLSKLGYTALEGVKIIPPLGSQCVLSCFKGPDFHKKLLDFEKKAIAGASPFALVVASVNDWFNLLVLSKRDSEAFTLDYDKLLLSLSLIDVKIELILISTFQPCLL